MSVGIRMSYCKYTLLQLIESLRHRWLSHLNNVYELWKISLDFNGCNFMLNKDKDHSSNENGYCITMKTARICSEDGESAVSLSTNDFSDGD